MYMLNMRSKRFNVRFDTSHQGPLHRFKEAGVVADNSTCITAYNIRRARMWYMYDDAQAHSSRAVEMLSIAPINIDG
jgi:hypothetical protein